MSGRQARRLREQAHCRRVGFGNTQRWIRRQKYRQLKRAHTHGR